MVPKNEVGVISHEGIEVEFVGNSVGTEEFYIESERESNIPETIKYLPCITGFME